MAKKKAENTYEKTSNSSSANGKSVPFAVVEAYKTIRTNLSFMMAQSTKKIVTVSSPLQGEGKSTLAVNLAIAFAQLNNKVLLIDGDLRLPTVHKKLKMVNTKGLSSILVGFSTDDDSIVKVNDFLDVITAGPIPPNPSELVGSIEMDNLLDRLSQKYDYIIIDTPPVNVVSDALVLGAKTTGILLLIKSGITTYEQCAKALGAVEFSNLKLLGMVVNGVGENRKLYKYKYKYKYAYHYKYGYGNKTIDHGNRELPIKKDE